MSLSQTKTKPVNFANFHIRRHDAISLNALVRAKLHNVNVGRKQHAV